MIQRVLPLVRPKLTLMTALILSASALSGCSSIPFFSSGGDDYPAARLDVPPAFTVPSQQSSLALPEIASARAAEASKKTGGGSGVLVRGEGVKVMGGPDSRYLSVDAMPDAVWPKLQSFLQDEGYTVKKVEPGVGLIETDWTGSQSTAQSGFSLMKLLNATKNTFFKPDNIEKVRIRIEQGETPSQTLVFVTSQKMALTGEQPLFPGDEKDSYKYADAKPDPTLSADVLARLTAYLSGKTEAESRAMMAASFAPRAKLFYVKDKDERYIVVSQPYPRVWNRLGLALDRLGFDPVKSDQKNGMIEVTHPHPQALYADVALRGERVDLKKPMKLQLTLKVSPQKDGSSRIDIERIQVDGGSLPQDRFVILSKINTEME